MMDDDVIDQMEPGYIELARRLEAYADLRLSPSAAATTRMRTAVMAAAHRRAALIEADATFDAAGSTSTAAAATLPGPTVATRTSWRRPLAAVFAGALTLAILAGSVYGARAGGPLYAARLWAEMGNLPTNVVDRAQAEASRLEAAARRSAGGLRRGRRSGDRGSLVGLFDDRRRGGQGEPGRSDSDRGHRSHRDAARRDPDRSWSTASRHRPAHPPCRRCRRARWRSTTSTGQPRRAATGPARPTDRIRWAGSTG